MIHELKTWPVYFQAVIDGTKRFEIRKDDRPFAVGDTLRLREYEPRDGTYTGRETTVNITYAITGGPFRVPGHVVMSISPADPSRPVEALGPMTPEELKAELRRLFAPIREFIDKQEIAELKSTLGDAESAYDNLCHSLDLVEQERDDWMARAIAAQEPQA